MSCIWSAPDWADGQNVKFHVRHLDAVAGVLPLRRRKEVRKAELARLAEMGEATRFPAKHSVQSAGSPAPAGEVPRG
jgi:hypothetical protein